MGKLKWWHWVLIVFGVLFAIGLCNPSKEKTSSPAGKEGVQEAKDTDSKTENFECLEGKPKIPEFKNISDEQLKEIYKYTKDVTVALRPTYSKAPDYMKYVVSQPFVYRDEKTTAYNKGVEVMNLLAKAQKDIDAIPMPKLNDSLSCCISYIRDQTKLFLGERYEAVEIFRDGVYTGVFPKVKAEEAVELMRTAQEKDLNISIYSSSFPFKIIK